MYNPNAHSGIAETKGWMHLNDADIQEVLGQEGLDANVGEVSAKFAMLTYQVNATPIELSGDINVDSTNVYDIYSRIVETDGSNYYMAFAPPGTGLAEAKWQIQKILPSGSRQWASNAQFNQVATPPLSGLTYNY
ncbi:MAG TPA: hypothetical protein PLA71_00460 [Saccharofermentans sp.]|nr:hypothetical protein [Saccharofermentans sp.]